MVKYESVRVPSQLLSEWVWVPWQDLAEEALKEITESGDPLMRNELTLNVNRLQLLAAMEVNLDRHRKVHEEAVDGYRRKAEEMLREALITLEKDRHAKVQVVLAFPENHEPDYKRAIALLQASDDATVQMNESQYACYALDQWGWTRSFRQTARFYGSGTSEELPDFES